MRYLTFDEIVKIHERMIEVFGGESGILSENALENCVAMPMMSIFGTETSSSLWSKAATLLLCIANRHPFVDGNKRTAWTAAKVFLRLNGFRLTTTPEDGESTVIGVVRGIIDQDDLADWIRNNSEPVQSN
ncbi:MAG: type II toxin-antitoxin system death-on-curing family toxin [Candidatus Thorarchaeota archaeon]|nr:type II toxin-antitoxin system death-on-curing family toxin [Candidatus Thorarchaeota archaeon]MCJ7818158.1 type II toxin-antitoxin system death-on-curing family toxin [Candidatus Thorarchaeota archaeon]TFH03266.1 MAG: type II toxin-antitoxin system death-on-curing family toxin [Candidatus Thorarchaeota archaeon]